MKQIIVLLAMMIVGFMLFGAVVGMGDTAEDLVDASKASITRDIMPETEP